MPTPLISFVVAVTLALQSVPAASQFNNSSIPIAYEATVIENSNGLCPTAEERQEAQDKIRSDVRGFLHVGPHTCGDTSGWDLIAYLNMSNSSHQCPGDFREVTFDGIRLCARDSGADSNSRICTSVTFSSNGIPYGAVCGRVIGYQYGSGIGFWYNTYNGPYTIDEYYVDGVTLTHGPVGAREHIWTFATGRRERLRVRDSQMCPCAPNLGATITVPAFIGDDYFCESGSYTDPRFNRFYNDPLWDGDGCRAYEGNTCCTFNNPPYFTKQLPASTSDDIELRDCMSTRGVRNRLEGTDTLVQFIELYVK